MRSSLVEEVRPIDIPPREQALLIVDDSTAYIAQARRNEDAGSSGIHLRGVT